MLQLNFTPFPIIKTSRLILRKLKREDENEVYALRKDEEVNRFLGREKAKSIDDARSFISKILTNVATNQGILWAITLKEDDRLIGSIVYYNISAKESRAELGYELSPAFQGKGIMKEAVEAVIQIGFDQFGFESIEGWPTANNIRSIQLLEKLNFKMVPDDPRLNDDHNKGMRIYLLKRNG